MNTKKYKFNDLQKKTLSSLNLTLDLENPTSDEIECIEQKVGKRYVLITVDKEEESYSGEKSILKSILDYIDSIKNKE
jgi:hypothetical protein